MTPLDIESIERRVEAATPGPWMVDSGMNYTRDGDSDYQHILAAGGNNPNCGDGIADTYHRPSMKVPWDGKLDYLPPRHGRKADAAFIAHARSDVPELVREVKRLRQRVKDLETMVNAVGDVDWDRLIGEQDAPNEEPPKISAAVSDVGDTTGVISGTRKEQEP